MITQEIIPVKDELRLRFSIAQLKAGAQDWDGTIAAVDEWSRWSAEPNPLGYYLKAIAYFQKNDPENAITNAEAAIDWPTSRRRAGCSCWPRSTSARRTSPAPPPSWKRWSCATPRRSTGCSSR